MHQAEGSTGRHWEEEGGHRRLRLPQVRLLRTRMLGLVESFQKPETKDLLGLMEIVGDTLHRMGPQGIGACSLKLARHLRRLFENVSPRTHARACAAARPAHQSEQPELPPSPHPPLPGDCG